MSQTDINAVADYLITSSSMGLSNKELQKLLYFSQGFYLAQTNEPLFDATLAAWAHGPVNSTIWHRFKGFGYLSLNVASENLSSTLSENKKAFLSSILLAFSVLGQTTLIDMTHTDSPWQRNYIGGMNRILDQNEIKQYFREFESVEQYILIAQGKVEFLRLLEKRKLYLNTLPSIGDDWISGKSVAPTVSVCNACAQFFETFARSIFSRFSAPFIPKLLLGPIPSGGVGAEFHLREKNLYVHFHNTAKVEVTVERKGEFDEYELSQDQFLESVGEFLAGAI